MSSSTAGLLSATFYEDGYDHLVELVHQRDAEARRHLSSLEISVYGGRGECFGGRAVDPTEEILDLTVLTRPLAPGCRRVMVTFDARYEPNIFPYRPHHYGYLHRRGSVCPPLYYAINATLGGVPDRVGASGLNNFETYLFRSKDFAERYSVLLGNPARFADARAEVFAHYGPVRVMRHITLEPKAHTEVEIAGEQGGRRLERVDVKALFKLATYVVGRDARAGDLLLFDHLFTYFK